MGAINVLAGSNLMYGDVTFSAFTKSKITANPEYSESGRVVTFVTYDIEIEAKIGGAGASDLTLEHMRLALTTPGLVLRHQSLGFGNFIVNLKGFPFDSDFGPKPELLSWTPLGGGTSCIVVWRCKTRIPECAEARYTGLITIEYDVEVSIDVDEYSTQTISGYCLCAQTRQAGNNRVQLSVDKFKEQCTPDERPGFMRVTRDWKISKSRNRADFTFRDVEMATPIPNEMKTIRMNQTISSSMKKGYFSWDLRFSGSANVPAGSNKLAVFEQVLIQVIHRIAFAKKNEILKLARFLEAGPFNKKEVKGVLIPLTYSVTEAVYGKEINFEMSFSVSGAPIEVVLFATQMFFPIVANKYTKHKDLWKFHADRGDARLQFAGGDEVLIDLCTEDKARVIDPHPEKIKPKVLAGGGGPPLGAAPASLPHIPEESSWLAYECDLQTVSTSRVAVHKRLPVEDPDRYATLKTSSNATSSASHFALAPDDSIPQPQSMVEDVIQNLGSPSYMVALVGSALRLQHKPAVPRLVSINGVPATEVSAVVSHGSRGAVGQVPIQAAYWNIVYVLPRKPEGELPNLANPQLRTDGG